MQDMSGDCQQHWRARSRGGAHQSGAAAVVALHLLCMDIEVENVQDYAAYVPPVGGTCVMLNPDKEVELWVETSESEVRIRECFNAEKKAWTKVASEAWAVVEHNGHHRKPCHFGFRNNNPSLHPSEGQGRAPMSYLLWTFDLHWEVLATSHYKAWVTIVVQPIGCAPGPAHKGHAERAGNSMMSHYNGSVYLIYVQYHQVIINRIKPNQL